MIRLATADDIKAIVGILQDIADDRDEEFDYDTAIESVRRQCILSGSTVALLTDGGVITGLLFAVLTNNGYNPKIVAQITTLWCQDNDVDRAQLLVDWFIAEAGDDIDGVMISMPSDQHFDLRGLEPAITTYRIR